MDRLIFRKPIPLSPLTEIDTDAREPLPWWIRYGLALGSIAIVALILRFLWPVDYGRVLLFLTAIILGAWYGGLGPGLLSTLVAVPLVYALALRPQGSEFLTLDDIGLLGLFAAIGALISLLEESRRRSEEALRRSRSQFKVILQGVADGITAQDGMGRVIFANDAAAGMVGYASVKTFINAPIQEVTQKFELMDEAGKPLPFTELPGRFALQEGKSAERTLRFRIVATGEEKWSVVKATPIFDEHGNTQLAINLFQDITALKEAESSLRAERERFRVTLSSIGDGVIATDTNGVVNFINPVAESLTGWSQTEALGRPLQEVFHIVNEETRQEVENPVERALREGVIVGLANHTALIAKDGTERPIDDSGAPIQHEDANSTGAVLIFRDVSERRRTEAELHESHARIVEILESLGDAFYAVDDDWRFTYVNHKAENLWGKRREELLGQVIWDVFPEVVGTHSQEAQLRAARERRSMEFEIVSPVLKNWIRVNVFPGNKGLSIYFQEITELKHAEMEREQLLREQQTAIREKEEAHALLDSLFSSAPVGLAFFDREIRFQRINPALASINGLPVENHFGRTPRELLPDVAVEGTEVMFRKVLETGQPIAFETSGETPALPRAKRHWIANYYPVHLRDEIIGVGAVVLEITERKQAEIERANLTLIIEQQRQRLKNILANVPGVVWEAWGKPDGAMQRIDFVSDYVETMLGYSVQEWLNTPNFWLTIVHPEDYARAAAESVAIFEGKQPGTSRFRWVAKDGRVIPVEAQSSVIRDESGQPLGMRGVTMDISERLRAEETLRESENRFRSVLQNMPVLLSVNDVDHQRIVWNKEAERVTGYMADEVIGNRNVFELMYPDAEYRNYLDEVFESKRGDYRDWELKTVCKDGSVRYIAWSNISKRFPVPGWPDWALGVDVTARKQAQDRTARLQAITAALSVAISRGQIAQICVSQSLEMLDAHFGGISLLSDDGLSLDTLDVHGAAQQINDVFARVPFETDTPVARAVRTQQPIWLASLEAATDSKADVSAKVASDTESQAFATLPLIVDGRAIGAISFGFRKPQRFDDQEQDFMLALAHQCSQAMERARLYEAERYARTEAEAAQRRLEFLAEASVILGSSLDYEDTLVSVARLAVPIIADWCVIDILDASGALHRLAISHANAQKQQSALQLQQHYTTLESQRQHTAFKVLQENRVWFDAEVSEERLAAEARDQEHLKLLRELGFKSEIVVPLTAQGKPLGTITLVMGESDRRYNEDDLALAEELARRAAVAVDNARLYGQAQQAREAAVLAAARIVRLQAVTAGLSQALTPAHVMDVILRTGALAVGAIAVIIVFVKEDGTTLELARFTGFDNDSLEDWMLFSVDDSSPLSDTVRTRSPIWISSPEAFQEVYSRPPADSERYAWASVPLMVEERVLGAISFSFSRRQDFLEEDRALIVSLALQCALALERARLYEAEQRARQQQAFLAEATAMLASSLDYEITLQSLALLAVPLIADWCSVHIVQEDGTVDQIAVAHADPAKVSWAYELQDRYPPDRSTSTGVWNVLKTGQPEFYPEITDEMLVAGSRDPEHLRLMREIGFKSAMIVPLTARGRTLGALSFVSAESGRRYDPSGELTLIQELARRASIAVDNSLLYHEVRRQRVLAEALHDTAIVLSSTLDLSEVLDQILGNIGRVVSHDAADIMFIEHGLASIVRSRGYAEHDLVQSEEIMLGVQMMVAETPTLRSIVETRQPLVIPDTQIFEHWVAVPNVRPIRSYLGVPILVDSEVIGFLNLNSLHPNYFTTQGESLQAFANQAAVAIRNARLHQQAQKLAALEERQRLARDLHDAVSQTLFSASVIAESLPRLWEREPDKIQPILLQLSRMNRGALAEMRTLLLELRPAALLNSGLGDLVHQLVQAIRGRREIEITLDVEDRQSLPPDVHIALYRIIQETLNNIIKHAQARTISIFFRSEDKRVEITINDDGAGFDIADRASGLGLGMMRERAEAIGALLQIASQAGAGTQVTVSWIAIPESNGTN